MECRPGCAACCIAPSINGAIPNMPEGKPANQYCENLDTNTLLCKIWGTDNYPELCTKFLPDESVCGQNRDEALQILTLLEEETRP